MDHKALPPTASRAAKILSEYIRAEGAQQVADTVGCTPATLAKIATGIAWPHFLIAYNLNTAYGITLEDWAQPPDGGDE